MGLPCGRESAIAERRCRSMNNRHFKHFRNPIVLKMLIAQMNGYPLFFSADRQHTYQSVCSKRLRIRVKYSTDTKSTKTIAIKFYYAPYIMGNLNFPHFEHFAATKCGKCAKFTLRELQKSVFLAFCTFCLIKSQKGAKSILREI